MNYGGVTGALVTKTVGCVAAEAHATNLTNRAQKAQVTPPPNCAKGKIALKKARGHFLPWKTANSCRLKLVAKDGRACKVGRLRRGQIRGY